MTEETSPGAEPTAREQRTEFKIADFVSLYVNHAAIQMSPFDVKLILGEHTLPGTESVIELKASISMSLHFAKMLGIILNQKVQEYENTVGPLKFPGTVDIVPAK